MTANDTEVESETGHWIPETCTVRAPARASTKTRARKDRAPKERACWDLRWTVDGQRFFRRFDRAADAEAYATDLHRGQALGWPYDERRKRFIAPNAETNSASSVDVDDEYEVETVFTWTAKYWQYKWPQLEPKGRAELSRYLNRARGQLVDTTPTGDDATAVNLYLRSESLTVEPRPSSTGGLIGAAWLETYSLPLASVGRVELERLVEHYSMNYRDPSKRVAPASLRRMIADLRQCWDRAVQDDVIPMNPWAKVDVASSTRYKRAPTRPALAADAELVLSPEQVWQLADACVEHGTWSDSVRAFVLVMGFCGLRPSEACGLVVGDLDLPDYGPGWVTVRRSKRRVPGWFIDADEDSEWGPLKGRQVTDTRRAPVPATAVPALREHLVEHCAGAAPQDLVFTRTGRPFDLSLFQRYVWVPARSAMFPPVGGLPADSPLQPKLSRLRRHDLRHSACSLWLRAGVDVAVCQKWSGHKRLSVFLDVYQGLIPGREEDGVRRVDDLLGASGSAPARA